MVTNTFATNLLNDHEIEDAVIRIVAQVFEVLLVVKAKENILSDIWLLIGGFFLSLFYVAVMISNYNSVEHRLYLAILGIIAISYGAGASIGFGQLFGQPFSNIHYLLPFLFLGIGIDDLFVIVQALENIPNSKNAKR